MKNEFQVVGQHLETGLEVRENSLDLLNHSVLDKDPLYSTLKSDLVRYYKKQTKRKENFEQNLKPGVKGALYSNLHSLLSEVTYTKDQVMQKKMLNTIHNWYLKKKPDKERLPSISHSHHKSHQVHHPHTLVPDKSSYLDQEHAVHRTRSPYLPRRYQSSDSVETYSNDFANEHYLNMRKKEIASIKESEKRAQTIAKWGHEKSRADSDYTQKTEQVKVTYKLPPNPEVVLNKGNYAGSPSLRGTVYDFCANPNPANDQARMTPDINKINKLRKLHASLLDVEEEFQLPKKKKNESSMYIYKPNEFSDSTLYARPKSSDKIVKEQFEEVLRAKSKLAAANVSIPVENLIQGLVLPNDVGVSISPDMLPRGGEGLIVNPFVKFGKKKKKGKKKGKKKKKN